MKISREQKAQNRKKIISAFVELVIEKGLKNTTMRETARKAGFGDATIYNYFSVKEAMVYAYYEDRFDETVQKLQEIPDFHAYTFQEQLQTLFETLLGLCMNDREFLDRTFKPAFFTFSQQYKRVRPLKDKLTSAVRDIFEAAIEAEEIPEQIFLEMMVQMYWEYAVGIIVYWLADDSDHFERTSVLIDKSLDVSCAAIRAGIANKVFDIGLFFFKNHVLSRMEGLKGRSHAFSGIKRRFMEVHRGTEYTDR